MRNWIIALLAGGLIAACDSGTTPSEDNGDETPAPAEDSGQTGDGTDASSLEDTAKDAEAAAEKTAEDAEKSLKDTTDKIREEAEKATEDDGTDDN